jgi:hypothetical protein
VRETNAEIWERAQRSPAASKELHGYSTIGEIMTAMTPLTGELYVESLHMTRVAREAYVVIGGKYPHPQTVVPGGISATIDLSDMNEIHLRIVKFFDYGQKVVGVYNDLIDFFYEVNPQYREVGRRPANLIETGQWDDPEAYDGTFANVDDWARKRWAPPAVIRDGELATKSMTALNMGVEEFVEHSFYEDWTEAGAGNGAYRFEEDPNAPAAAEPPVEQGDDRGPRRRVEGHHGPPHRAGTWSMETAYPASGRAVADDYTPPGHRADRQEPLLNVPKAPAAPIRVGRPLRELGRVRGNRAGPLILYAPIAYENLSSAWT